MKSISLLAVVLLLATTSLVAQSNSYQTLKHKFKDQPDVHSFSVSGWVGRLRLNMVGEHEFKKAIKDLDHVRFMVIPMVEFSEQHVSVNGFKKILKKESYEELAVIRDQGGVVFIYLNEGSNNKNHYFALVEEENEVVAIEMKGYLDPNLLNSKNTTVAINK